MPDNLRLLRRLSQRIRAIQAERPHFTATIPLGLPPLEDALPERRLPAGSLIELLADSEGAGAWTLALVMAQHACGQHKHLVIADGERQFYPPGAVRLGIDLERTLVVRPEKKGTGTFFVLGAVTQSLRCAAVGAVIVRLDQLPTTDFRRLQLAAESGGGVGLLLRPLTAQRTHSFAAVRLVVTPVAGVQASRRIQVEVVRLRGGKPGQSFWVEINDETGHVSVLSSLAATKPRFR